MSFSSHLPHIDGEAARSFVVGSIVSYGRAQTFLSGSNLASTPVDDNVFGATDDEGGDYIDPYEAEDDESDWDNDRDRLVRAAADHDEEFVVGTTGWDEDEPTPTALGPPTTLSGPSRPRAFTRPIPSSSRASRTRFTSTPTVPSSSVRASRGRGGTQRPLGGVPHISPPTIDARPSSAPVAPRFMPSSPTAIDTHMRRVDERTPLISISGASSTYSGSTPTSEAATVTGLTIPPAERRLSAESAHHKHQQRRSSTRPARVVLPPGRSTYGQTLFNSIAILLGIGMLSCPLAFACAGWFWGTVLLTFYGFLTCYTAKVLAKMVLQDPRLRTYADIGQAAFGPKANGITSFLFCLELFAVSVILVVLFSDSLHEVLPQWSSNTYKILGLVVIIPTSFFPLRVLSFASILGVLSTFMLIFVLLEDGLTKTQAPGSLWDSAHTELFPKGALGSVPIAFGLFMAGFSGHAVIPSIVRDMQDPVHYESMINWAFLVATLVYGAIGAAGYRMFGHNVHDEVSQDLLRTPGFSPFLNKVALWMLVLSPLTKFSLSARPMNVTIEILFGIEESSPVPAHNKPRQFNDHAHAHLDHEAGGKTTDDEGGPHVHFLTYSKHAAAIERRKAFGRAFERTMLTVVVVLVAIYVPDFSTSMAFLGAFSAFTLCVIGPLAAKMSMERRVTVHDTLLIAIAVVMAVWATWLAITSASA